MSGAISRSISLRGAAYDLLDYGLMAPPDIWASR